MNDLAIMSLIEQRDFLNEKVNNLEEENQQLIETNDDIFIKIEELKSLIKEAKPWLMNNKYLPYNEIKSWLEKAEKIK